MPDMHPPDGQLVRYEKSDATIGGIIAFGVALAVLGVLGHLTVAGLFDYLKQREEHKQLPLAPLAARERPQLPRDLKKIPEPRLQTSEPLDMNALRKAEELLLSNYGWVDRDNGIVRIPIDEAMRLLSDSTTAQRHDIRVRSVQGKKP